MSDQTRVKGGPGPETIRVLRAALIDRLLPHTYVSAGALVHMETVSGSLATIAADEDAPLPVAASTLTPAGLRLIDGLTAAHLENERQLLSALTEADQRRLADLLRKLQLGLPPA